jgi:hypothetical protein
MGPDYSLNMHARSSFGEGSVKQTSLSIVSKHQMTETEVVLNLSYFNAIIYLLSFCINIDYLE